MSPRLYEEYFGLEVPKSEACRSGMDRVTHHDYDYWYGPNLHIYLTTEYLFICKPLIIWLGHTYRAAGDPEPWDFLNLGVGDFRGSLCVLLLKVF